MNNSIQDVLARLDAAENDRGRKFQLVAIGCREDIHATIHTLHLLRFAEVALWSPLMPVPNSTSQMSILTRYLSDR